MAGVAVPAAWSQPVPVQAGTNAQWWARFGDPVLVQLIAQAQLANTDVAGAEANLRQARALRSVAAAGLWPQLSLGGSVQRGRQAGAGSTSSLFETGLDASWEADLFGATRHAVASSEAQAQASAATLAAVRVSVAAEVALAYLDLRGSQVRTAVARDNLAAQEQTLQIALWREQAGLASSVESAQARVAVEQIRAQLPVLESSAAQAIHAVSVLTGQPPAALDALLSPAGALPQLQPPPTVAIPAAVLRQRPDVRAAELQLQAAAQQVAQADAQRLPVVQLRASLAWSAATLGSLGSVAAARSLLASGSGSLFDAGQARSQLAAQQAAFDSAREAYRAKVLGALQEVEDALVANAAADQRLAALANAVQAAGDAALLASQRYSSGLIDFLTVLDTQRSLLSLQDSQASAEADRAAGAVRLYKALGGGWQPETMEQAL
jgi:multidrug efflux system outer membrane protein